MPLDAQGVGTFTFKKDMHPNDLQGFEVVAAFREKNVELYNLSSSGNVSMTASRVSLGESVAIDLPQEKLNEGYKLTQVTLTASDGSKTAKVPVSNGRFVVPANWTGVTGIKVFVEAADMAFKEIPIEGNSVNASVGEGGEQVGGKLTPTVGRADRGETVNVQITPMSGCRVQAGTAYAVVTVGKEQFQVPLERISDTVWQFQVPATIEDVQNASITLTADFEAGKDKFTSGSFSVGAALGVHWVDAENYARVLYEADVTAKNVRLSARSSGTDTLTVKAGYNQSDVGVAGAIAVQVSGFDTQATVNKFAKLNLTDGSRLDVAARSGLTFALTADASGQKQQGASVGVGAGIAVAVRGADVLAQVEEGVLINAPKNATLGDFNIDARQAVAETVTARAGSAGGVSVTPVAAVDVFGSSAQARMGDVKVSGKPTGVSLSASGVSKRDGDRAILNLNDGVQMTATLSPSTAVTDLEWKSTNTKHGNVNSNGWVTYAGDGDFEVEVKTKKEGKTAKYKFKAVDQPYKVKMTYAPDIKVGETVQFKAEIEPKGTSSGLTWSSSDDSIATVDSNGNVYGKKKGTVKIYVRTDNGKETNEKIKVK